jgi:DNA-directed RNA polymerase specialized sigma24 family protein
VLLSGADNLPAREMARLLQRPVEAIYPLRQRLMKRIKEKLADNAAVKTWLASV